MPITNEVVGLSRAYARDLRRMTDEEVAAIVRAWAETWDELNQELSYTLETALDTGQDFVSAPELRRDNRLERAIEQSSTRVSTLTATTTAGIVAAAIPDVVLTALRSETAILRAQLPPDAWIRQAGITDPLVRELGSAALDAIVERTTQQIHNEAYLSLTEDMVSAMNANLRRGVAVGDNPRQAARRMMDDLQHDFNGGLSRATTIARTEMVDAGRVAKAANAAENADLLEGWVWSCTLDGRTCIACLEMNGQLFSVETTGPEGHPNCRCDRIDKFRPWEDILDIELPGDEPADQMPDARAWFENLTEESQREILGPRRFEMWQSGEVSWGDFSVRKDNSNWRPGYYQKPIRDL